jgi:hypothetical protein
MCYYHLFQTHILRNYDFKYFSFRTLYYRRRRVHSLFLLMFSRTKYVVFPSKKHFMFVCLLIHTSDINSLKQFVVKSVVWLQNVISLFRGT